MKLFRNGDRSEWLFYSFIKSMSKEYGMELSPYMEGTKNSVIRKLSYYRSYKINRFVNMVRLRSWIIDIPHVYTIYDDKGVCVAWYVISTDHKEICLYVSPLFRRMGLGKEILESVTNKYKIENVITNPEDVVSEKMLESAGYDSVGSAENDVIGKVRFFSKLK